RRTRSLAPSRPSVRGLAHVSASLRHASRSVSHRSHSTCLLPALDLTPATRRTGRPAACPRTEIACPPFPLNRAPVALSILRREPQRLARPPRRGPRAATSIRRAVRLGEKTKAVGPPQPAPCAPICVSRPRTNPIYQRLDCVRTRSLHRCGRAQVRSAECEASVAVRSRGSRLKRGMVSTQLRSTQLRLPGGDSDPVHAEVSRVESPRWRPRFEADAPRSPSTQHDRRVPGRARVESRKWRRRPSCDHIAGKFE
ncbi:hypothetical protein C8R43DRAFT_1051332, partial [Mycena crocata]